MTKHIVVIGGGVTGLAAAQALLARGYQVTQLEQQNRLGGRIYSKIRNTKTGQVYDLVGHELLITEPDWVIEEDGAEWIHNADKDPKTGIPNPVKQMADELQIATVAQNSLAMQIIGFDNQTMSLYGRAKAGTSMYLSGASSSLSFTAMGAIVEKKCAVVEKSFSEASSSQEESEQPEKSSTIAISYQDVLDEMVKDGKPDLAHCDEATFMSSKAVSEQFCQFYLAGTDTAKASALTTLNTFTGNDYFVTGGYNRITQSIYEKMQGHPRYTLKLQTRAITIRHYMQTDKPTLVMTMSGDESLKCLEELQCDGVVVAIPATLLQQAIDVNNHKKPFEFVPPLPQEKINLINKVHAGNMLKVHFHFAKPFWQQGCQYILPLRQYREIGIGKLWFSIVEKPSQKIGIYSLTVCFYGEEAQFTNMDEAAILDFARAKLRGAFGNAYIPPISANLGHRWNLDPNAAGAWCTMDAKMTKDQMKELAKPLGTLYFAGDLDACDTVHASLLSGQKAAAQILSAEPPKKSQDSAVFATHKTLAAFEEFYLTNPTAAVQCKYNMVHLFKALDFKDQEPLSVLFDLIGLYDTVKSRQYTFIGAAVTPPFLQTNTPSYEDILALLKDKIREAMKKLNNHSRDSNVYRLANEIVNPKQVAPTGWYGYFASWNTPLATPTPVSASTDDDNEDVALSAEDSDILDQAGAGAKIK